MTRRPVRDVALIVLSALLCGGATCVSSDGETTANRGTGYDAYDDRPDRSDRYSDRPNRIPRNADIVREGTGKLRWRADLDGVVYLYDRGDDTIRYTGPLRRGDEIIVQPDDNHVRINDRVVSDENLARNNAHQLFFAANNRPTRDDDYERRRDADRRSDNIATRRPDLPAVAPGDVPRTAKKMDRGGGAVSFAVPADGMAYVFDEDAKAVVFRTPLKRGTTFKVVPREGKVYVDAGLVSSTRFAKGHTLTLYFDKR